MCRVFLAVLAAHFFLFHPLSRAQSNPCDLNKDGAINIDDVQLSVNMYLGLVPCTANINGVGVCNIVVIQRVASAVSSGICVVDHSATLSWTASASANVSGYNVYRRTISGGPYSKLNSSVVAGLSFTDSSVQAGQTYYYVATAVDNTAQESSYSNEASATIPVP